MDKRDYGFCHNRYLFTYLFATSPLRRESDPDERVEGAHRRTGVGTSLGCQSEAFWGGLSGPVSSTHQVELLLWPSPVLGCGPVGGPLHQSTLEKCLSPHDPRLVFAGPPGGPTESPGPSYPVPLTDEGPESNRPTGHSLRTVRYGLGWVAHMETLSLTVLTTVIGPDPRTSTHTPPPSSTTLSFIPFAPDP